MKTQRLSLDRISTLPDNIIEHILTLMSIRDALRTNILSTKWRYRWRSMPKLVFTEDMVTVQSSKPGDGQLRKYKLISVIFHVLLLHNGPTILESNCCIRPLDMDSEFAQIISYLARGNKVKELVFATCSSFYKLPVSFFSMQGLELIRIMNSTFEPPLTFNGFSRLKSMTFGNVKVSAQMLQRFLSKCLLLESISLIGGQQGIDFAFVAGGNKFTFVDLLKYVPLIKTLDVTKDYAKYMCADVMPNMLPTSLVHLEYLYLDVCLMEQNEISSALCIIRSTPVLEELIILMYDNDKSSVQQTPTNFLDPEDYSDLKLDHLKTLQIEGFSNLPLEREFLKLIMAKSPVLEKVLIKLNDDVSVDEELKILRGLVRLPFPRASPSAKLTIERPEAK